ncbi:MAG: DNA-directed DNA polymerase, partial [Candidatus Pacearchaeota archaeon]
MDIRFIPIDYSYFDYEGRNYAKIFGRSGNGKRICLIDKCDVFFYAILNPGVKEKEIKNIIEKILSIEIKSQSRITKVLSIKLEKKNFLGKEVKALKITISNHKDLKEISEQLPHKYFQHIRELDINYITRYILETNLIPLTWHEITGEIIGREEFGGILEILDVDLIIEVSSIKKTYETEFIPKILAFDIETDRFEIGKGEITMIAIASEKIKKVLTHKKIPSSQDFVHVFKNEKEMLEAFSEEVKKSDSDILVGYFSDGFDLPYLKTRAEKNKVKLSLGIDNSLIKFSGGNNPSGKISGIVHVDLFKFIQTAYSQYLESETLGLGDVASELLDEKKVEYEFKFHEKMSNEDWKNFFEYNMQDANITYKLFMKTWHDQMEFSRIMQEPLFNVTRDGLSSQVESYIIHNIRKYNEIIEKKPTHEEISIRRERDKYEGAFVLTPKPKLYENIVMFDFTSYWPSIISTFNLSRVSFLGDKKTTENSIKVNTGKKIFYFSKKKSFFPEMLEEIIKKRKQYKEEYKKSPSAILKARSNAFKLLANASYGYQGFFGARYYCPEASAAATAISREYIKKTIESAEKFGLKAIYSDTDSIALELGKKTKKHALELLKKINDSLPGVMELELEDFYRRGIWVTTRNGKFGAKKKYALINESEKLKIRGFETVRRDWCRLARETQNKVLDKILREGNEKSALEYVKKIVKDIKERNIDKKLLIIKTQLRKPLSEYKANTPHITIAKKLLDLGHPVNIGMLIEYYIAENENKKALARDKAVFPED